MGEVSTKWRKYRKTSVIEQICSYIFVQKNYIKAHVFLYFLYLVLTFTPMHYIIMVKGLLSHASCCSTYRDILVHVHVAGTIKVDT